jgi:hypothetical protein
MPFQMGLKRGGLRADALSVAVRMAEAKGLAVADQEQDPIIQRALSLVTENIGSNSQVRELTQRRDLWPLWQAAH